MNTPVPPIKNQKYGNQAQQHPSNQIPDHNTDSFCLGTAFPARFFQSREYPPDQRIILLPFYPARNAHTPHQQERDPDRRIDGDADNLHCSTAPGKSIRSLWNRASITTSIRTSAIPPMSEPYGIHEGDLHLIVLGDRPAVYTAR